MVFGLFDPSKPQRESSFDLDLEEELPDIDSIGLEDELDSDLDDDFDDDDTLDVDFEEI